MSSPRLTLSAHTPSGKTRTVLFGILLALALTATVQYGVRYATARPDDPLHGDTEEASAALAEIMANMPAIEQAPRLLRYADDPSPGLRYAAVDALGKQRGVPGVAEAIDHAFTDSSSVVRQRSLELLPDVDRDLGRRLLLTGLKDEDTWIREAAVTQINTRLSAKQPGVDRRAVPALIEALGDTDPVMPALAVSALRKLTGQPWHYRNDASAAEKQAVLSHWRQWWTGARSPWPAAEYTNIAARAPARTDPAPEYRLEDIDGKAIRSDDRRGRLTLLNFWGTWCPPCQQEVPDLVRLDRVYRSRGVDVIGVAVAEPNGADTLRRWWRLHGGITYRQTLATPALQEAFGDIHEVPFTVLVDGQGRIRRRWEGERDYGTFRAAVEQVLQSGQ